MITMHAMTKPKATQKDRHKKRRMAGIRKQFHQSADVLVERLGLTGLTDLVNLALREKLEREGLWPPKDKDNK